MHIYYPILAFLFSSVTALAQDTIYLKNPSFEGVSLKGGYAAWNLKAWQDCGPVYFTNQSPPDVHGHNTDIWGVNITPLDGKTCLGLVTRHDNSFESVSQQLTTELKGGLCYTLTAYACQSPMYNSLTSRSKEKAESFVAPTTLRIWGGNKSCSRYEILFESEPIDATAWTPVHIIMRPLSDISWISIEVYFEREQYLFPNAFNGHLLIDHLSGITEVTCD